MLARQFFANDLVTWVPISRLERAPPAKRDLSGDLPWSGKCHQLTCSGAAALYHVGRALKLEAGDELLVPAYHCGKEVGAFRCLGVRPVFYRIDEDLAPRIQHIETLINPRTKAILVTHFFGFPAPLDALKSLCRAHGIRLIEDCAHALFGQGPLGALGSSGDAAIFSPRKFLPIPDGGIAVLNDPDLDFPDEPTLPMHLLTAARLLSLWHKSLKLNAPLGRRLPRRLLFATAWPLLWSTSKLTKSVARVMHQWDADLRYADPPSRYLMQGMSPHSQRAIEQLPDPRAIVRARRDNYERLLTAARAAVSVEPLFSTLPSGVNPLFFPLRCRTPQQTAQALRRQGVLVGIWWRRFHDGVTWQDFPIEQDLKSSVLALPVHQTLTREAVSRIATSLEDLRLPC